jgi:nucleotide-binding universal stress UspA family protein
MKVVVAVDGSKYARWVLEWLGRLPFAAPPEVLAVHVVDTGAIWAPFVAQPPVPSIQPFLQAEIQRLEQHAKHVQKDTEQLLASLRMKGKVKIEHGRVAPTILRHASRARLVAVGHRGLDALDRFFLGSVSEKVIHHASCSVLVVKEPARLLRRILLATDGSRASGKVLQFLLREFRPKDPGQIEVIVIHVMPFLKYPELRKSGEAILTRYAERLTAAGYTVRELPELGNPGDQILKAAERHKSDLIVCGAKGLGAVARFFLGSVSTKLIQHAPCSALVVRS